MGADLTGNAARPSPTEPEPWRREVQLIPWLDSATAAGVADIVQSLAAGHPEALAVILFGSVARREERPLDDPEPSDVDLLLVLDATALTPSDRELTREQELALHHTVGMADYRHSSPREIKVLFAARDLARWDSLFIENVARDGILLWARSPLPAPLAPVAEHDISSLLSTTLR